MMIANAVDRSRAREEFVSALQKARAEIIAKGGGSDLRALGLALGVSPSRVGDWLRPNFAIAVRDASGAPVSDARLRKTVAGFYSTARRAVDWLKASGHLSDKGSASNPELLLQAYWPDAADRDFERPPVRGGVDDAKASSSIAEAAKKLRVEVHMMSWNAFGQPEDDADPKGFLAAYARTVFNTIGPDNCPMVIKLVDNLEAGLNATPRGEGDSRVVKLGLYNSVDRRLNDSAAVDIPLFRAPLMGLEIQRGEGEWETHEPPLFETVFGRQKPDVSREVWAIHLQVAASHLAAYRDDANILPHATAREPDKVAGELRKAALDESGPIYFLADGTIALQVLGRLDILKGIKARPIVQQHLTDIAYSIGFMLREQDDDDLGRLIKAAQDQIFRTPWRVADLFEDLAESLESWVELNSLDEVIERHDVPIFVFDRSSLTGVADNRRDVLRMKKALELRIEQRPDGGRRISRLWRFDPKLESGR